MTEGFRDFGSGELASIYIDGFWAAGGVDNGGTGMTKYTMEDEDYGG